MPFHLHRAQDATAFEALPSLQRLAPWVHEASNPFADWYFGGSEIAAEIIPEWMQRRSSELYLGRTLLMVDERGTPLGCLIGLGGAELAKCRAADFVAFCNDLGSGPEAESVLEEVIPVARQLFPPVQEDELYISRVAVDPQRRSAGLGRAMVERAIALFRADGYGRFRLDVSADNVAAIRMYEAVGMRITGRTRVDHAGLEYCTMALMH